MRLPIGALSLLVLTCGGHSGSPPGGSTSTCVPLASVSQNCPPDWPAAMAAKGAFCAKEAPFFDAFLSTAVCRGYLHYTRYLFDGGPRFCVYDPTTSKLAGYAAFDGKAMFEQTSCGGSKADFDDQGCAGQPCPMELPDAAARAEDGPAPVPDIRCDLVDQTCAAGKRCDFFCENDALVIGCIPETPNAAPVGGDCRGMVSDGGVPSNNCSKGTGCFSGLQIPMSCHRYCRAGSPCPAGTTCDTTSGLISGCRRGSARIPAGICR